MGGRRNTVVVATNPLGLPAPQRDEQLWRRVHRQDALIRQGGRCCYCREPMRHHVATADHLTAQRAGGRTASDNIKAACQPCNVTKGHRTEKRFRQLIRCPGEDPSWSLLMAHMRYRLWTREEAAERRIMAVVGVAP